MQFWRKLTAPFNRLGEGRDRIDQERSLRLGYSSDSELSQPQLLEKACKSCGSEQLDRTSQTHQHCFACGAWWRVVPADADFRQESQQVFSITRAGRDEHGNVVIIEYDWSGGRIGSRPATR